ncbi:hypothetical protein F383_20853 [Gossypium arboreum]|uniref:Uncharacterized protein n=1 Tax=Gossypium arboreum TaxID=29729 RepID=A0A0B0NPE2_GOSAR|nr:hypothetical protein F383_20853 [Gossypium arboreum]
MDTRFPVLVVVLHMLWTHHSSKQHPIISPSSFLLYGSASFLL